MPADEPKPAESRQLDFLLADFGAVKGEIARHAGLQRVAIAMYLALVAVVAGSLLAGKNLSLPTVGLWVGGFLALLFCFGGLLGDVVDGVDLLGRESTASTTCRIQVRTHPHARAGVRNVSGGQCPSPAVSRACA